MANMRKPDNVLKLSGSYRKDRHGDPKDKIEMEIEAPEMPDFLDDVAAEEWKRVCRILENMGLLTVLDRTVLAQYCVLYSKLAGDPAKFGPSDHTQLRLCAKEMGFTPSARSGIKVPNEGQGEFKDL